MEFINPPEFRNPSHERVVVAQWLEHLSYSQGVEGSIPSNDFRIFSQPFFLLKTMYNRFAFEIAVG